jgi:hypothetical protein
MLTVPLPRAVYALVVITLLLLLHYEYALPFMRLLQVPLQLLPC